MQRLNDNFLKIVGREVPLAGLRVLEIGCGDGKRTKELAARCASIVAIDPDVEALNQARALNIANVTFHRGVGQQLAFDPHSFDVIVYTTSFHHIPADQWSQALDEAIRVARPGSYLVFYELGEPSTQDEADALFTEEGQCDATAALGAIAADGRLRIIADEAYETIYRYHSVDDFVAETAPTRNQRQIKSFLEAHNYPGLSHFSLRSRN